MGFSRHRRTASCQSQPPVRPNTVFWPGSWRSASKRKLCSPSSALQSLRQPVSAARQLAHVVLGVRAAVRAEREQLHQLARVVLVGVPRVFSVWLSHWIIAGSAVTSSASCAERAQRVAAEELRSGRACSAARRPRSRWRTSRARSASSARSAAGWCAPSGRGTTGGRGPRRRAGSSARSPSVGSAPVSVAAPAGRVSARHRAARAPGRPAPARGRATARSPRARAGARPGATPKAPRVLGRGLGELIDPAGPAAPAAVGRRRHRLPAPAASA